MRTLFDRLPLVVLLGLLCQGLPSTASGATGCTISYGWTIGNAQQGTLKAEKHTAKLKKGQTKTIGKEHLTYVQNLGANKVKFYLANSPDVTLDKNKRNPATGTYAQAVKLVKARCLNAPSDSARRKNKKSSATANADDDAESKSDVKCESDDDASCTKASTQADAEDAAEPKRRVKCKSGGGASCKQASGQASAKNDATSKRRAKCKPNNANSCKS